MNLNGVWVLTVITLLSALILVGKSEMFTSMAHLEQALYGEANIAEVILNYVTTEQKKLKKLKRIAEDMASHSSKALANPDLYLNPIDAFLFIKRFTLDWDNNVQKLIEDNGHEELRTALGNGSQGLPHEEDLEGAVTALMRLQDTYKLHTADIAQGKLRGHSFTELSASECSEIGALAYNAGDYNHSSQWLSHSLTMLKKGNDKLHGALNQTEALGSLVVSQFVLGYTHDALSTAEEFLRLEPENENAADLKLMLEGVLGESKTDIDDEMPEDDEMPADEEMFADEEMPADDERCLKEFSQTFPFLEKENTDIEKIDNSDNNYEALCRGENSKEIVNKHKLRCRYRTRDNPLLILSPVKEEDVYLDPWIAVYHDVMSDSEIETLKQIAMPKLRRAAVFAGREQTEKFGDPEGYRISKNAWFDDDDHPVVATLSARIGAITGLSMETAETLQVGNYGLGGYYGVHTDYAVEEEVFYFGVSGNRLATFMFYLSTVETGATVFPLLGVKIFPIKGAAVFWYNLHRNGKVMDKTLHAGCPVLTGSKWVANKWLHERGQEFIRPCGLSKEE